MYLDIKQAAACRFAYYKALHHIREAEQTGALELDLRGIEYWEDDVPKYTGLHTLRRLPPELERLTSLQSLNLSGCEQLSGDLSPLANLTSLQSLNLSGCKQLSGDLSPLASLTSLQWLNLSGDEQHGLPAGPQLDGDLSSLASLTSLQSLDLSECDQLSGDLSSLTSLTFLQSLNLTHCHQLSGDLSPLADLTALQSLDFSKCYGVSGDLSPLADLTSLHLLYLDGSPINDLFPLADLISLRELNLAGSLINDLSPLTGLTSLQRLCLDRCVRIRRFAPLESLLPTLKHLSLSGCKLDDLPPEVCDEPWYENLLYKVRIHYRRRLSASPKTAPPQPLDTPPQIFVSYALGNISPNATEEDHQRQEVVERLCRTLEQERWNLIRDKGALDYGDQISNFMKTLGQARLVIVVLSEKYLRSPYCMTELYSVYQNARQERQEFLNRIIPLVLKDARIGTPEDRVEHAKHWETRYLKLKADLDYVSDEDFGLYRRMKDWYNHVGNILTYVNDVLHPHGFDEIVKDDFAALRQMLERRRS